MSYNVIFYVPKYNEEQIPKLYENAVNCYIDGLTQLCNVKPLYNAKSIFANRLLKTWQDSLPNSIKQEFKELSELKSKFDYIKYMSKFIVLDSRCKLKQHPNNSVIGIFDKCTDSLIYDSYNVFQLDCEFYITSFEQFLDVLANGYKRSKTNVYHISPPFEANYDYKLGLQQEHINIVEQFFAKYPTGFICRE